jgi:hypothetical protein
MKNLARTQGHNFFERLIKRYFINFYHYFRSYSFYKLSLSSGVAILNLSTAQKSSLIATNPAQI